VNELRASAAYFEYDAPSDLHAMDRDPGRCAGSLQSERPYCSSAGKQQQCRDSHSQHVRRFSIAYSQHRPQQLDDSKLALIQTEQLRRVSLLDLSPRAA
jgi:hypothetical protein